MSSPPGTTIGGGLLSDHGLAAAATFFVFFRDLAAAYTIFRQYLRPHTRPHKHAPLFHRIRLHSHFPPNHTPALHSHLCSNFDFEMPALGVSLGLASVHAKDRLNLYIHTNHSINTHEHPTPTPLGKVYIRALVVSSFTPHQIAYGACKGTAQVGVSLVSPLNSI